MTMDDYPLIPTDAQSQAYREATEADWATVAEQTEGMRLLDPDDTEPVWTVEQWEAVGWDAQRGEPKTVEEARALLAERISDPACPDDEDTAGAYDDVPREERRGRARRLGPPRAAGGLYVRWLPDALRSAGLPVVLVPGWETRGHGGMRVCEGVVGHHTATSAKAAGAYPSLHVVRDGRAGLAGPLSQLGLGRDGVFYVIAAGLAWHAGASRWAGFVDLNDEFVGIEAESDGTGAWTTAQRDNYPKGVGALLRYMRRGTDRYISHRGCALPAGRKPDPSGLSDQWMRDLAGRQVAVVTAPVVAPAPAPASGLVISTSQNSRVPEVRYFQGFMNRVFPTYVTTPLVVDGDYGPASAACCREFQDRVKIGADGELGPTTRTHLARSGYRP